MSKKVFMLILALFAMTATTTAQVAINATNFPDENFRDYVLTNCDTDKNRSLSNAEIATVTEIIVFECSIGSLRGIENFTALTTLSCIGNQLTSLDVSKNTALTELYCSQNQLKSLDISKNTKLIDFSCHGNQLTTLDLSKNTALIDLHCDNNQLTSLDVTQLTALTSLDCHHNQLTSLDVSKNTALIRLDCFYNQLTSLDVSKNIALKSLNCANNRLTSLDVSENAQLASLECIGNQLITLDVSKNTVLESLFCQNNQLTTLNVSNTILNVLYCFSNKIKGDEMQKFIDSLPTSNSGWFSVINSKDNNEGNVITKAQVAIAKNKNWEVYDWNGDLFDRVEYEGSNDTAIEYNYRETINNNRYYSIDGIKLLREPTRKGIYIVNRTKMMK